MKCKNCQDGCVAIGEIIRYVSRDMAMDAGDLSLEGSACGSEIVWDICPCCEGNSENCSRCAEEQEQIAHQKGLEPIPDQNQAEHQPAPVTPLKGKYPKWMIGQEVVAGYDIKEDKPVMKICGQNDIHPGCHCNNPGESMMCLEGHLLECHAGQSCDEAHCSHFQTMLKELDQFDEFEHDFGDDE